MTTETTRPVPHFIRNIIEADLAARHNDGRLVTRFPPEPNGYLHIGHAKSICLNFGLATDYGGKCNLRFDDTNPIKEDVEYVEAIQTDVRWLGFDWEKRCYFASDYFKTLYGYALELIRQDLAYVCDLSADEVREHRGTLTEPGHPSPFRERSVADNLDLFQRMRAGEFADGARVLRAKIDMAHPNLLMRDPTLYRIRRTHHHRTGADWCIYPMYDFTHCLSDAIEGVTHSLCTLEFENNRVLYDWVLDHLAVPFRPRQYEFARLNLSYTVLSKRRLIELVSTKAVSGWDDPRMPTLSGLRRRGYTPASIRNFCERIGLARRDSMVDMALLEFGIREELNRSSPRMMAVLNPLRVVLVNYPENREEWLEAPNHPEDPAMGVRRIPFGRTMYIEREDFMEHPPKKFFRLAPGREIRLRYGYFITCVDVIRDADGAITELHCTYDPATRGGDAPDGRKVKATLHWVSAAHAFTAEVRLYDRLFQIPNPMAEKTDPATGRDWKSALNPDSLQIITNARLEPALAEAAASHHYQFERLGYFYVDPVDSRPGIPVFNRTVTLKDAWQRLQDKS